MLRQLHNWITAMGRGLKGVLALMAGAMTALALPPVFMWPVVFLTFSTLVVLLDGVSGRGWLWRFFGIGWCFGFGYFLAGLWWIGSAFLVEADTFAWLLPFAVMALPAGLALFWGAACALAGLVWHRGRPAGLPQIIALACAFGIAEFFRGTLLTGFPWNLVGYAAMPGMVSMQSAGLVGAYGMSALTVFAASMVAFVFRPGGWRVALPVVATLFAAHLGYGMWVLDRALSENEPGTNLRIVQPALTQAEKWAGDNEDDIMARYIRMSGGGEAGIDGVTHLIWPESAFPFVLQNRADRLAQIADFLPAGTRLITGAMRVEEPAPTREQDVFNALYVVGNDGALLEYGDKTRLVPFGEYLPFKQVLESIGLRQMVEGIGFTPGRARRVLPIEGAPPFVPLICYEIIFSGRLLPAGHVRPGWIVNVTNDGWFGKTPGPYQHFHQSRIRAVEEGLPVVRAANSGISGIIDPYGRIRVSLGLGEAGILDGALPRAIAAPLYARIGPWAVFLFICICFLGSVGLNRYEMRKASV